MNKNNNNINNNKNKATTSTRIIISPSNQKTAQQQQQPEKLNKELFKAYLDQCGTTLALQQALAALYQQCHKDGALHEDPLGFIADFLVVEGSSKSKRMCTRQSESSTDDSVDDAPTGNT